MIDDETKKFKKGTVLTVELKKDNLSIGIEGKVVSVKNGLVELKFINIDNFAKNTINFWCMQNEVKENL